MEIWGYAAGIFGVLVVVAGFLIMLGRKDQKAEDRDSKIAKLEKDYVSLDAKVSSLDPELRPRVTDAEKRLADVEAIVRFVEPRFKKMDEDHRIQGAQISRLQSTMDTMVGALANQGLKFPVSTSHDH